MGLADLETAAILGGMSLRHLALSGSVSLLLAAVSAQGAILNWDGGTANLASTNGDGLSDGGAGTWSTSISNWDNGLVPHVAWVTGSTALFGGAPGTVTLGTPISAAAVNFAVGGYTVSANGTNTLTLTSTGSGAAAQVYSNGGGLTNTIGGPVVVGANGAWFVGTGDTLNVTGAVSGTGTLLATGGGTFNYSGTGFAPGKFTINGGTTFNSSGTLNPTSGTYTGVGDSSNGTLNVTAGTLSAATTFFIANSGGNPSNPSSASTAQVNVSGGAITTSTTTALNIGDGYNDNGNGNGTLTISGTGSVSTNITAGNLRIGNNKGGIGVVNLNTGGTLATNFSIVVGGGTNGVTNTQTGGSSTFNFDGGMLRSRGTSMTIATGVLVNIRNGGAIFDTNTFATTISAPLLHSNISGDNAIDGGLTKTSTGTLTLNGVNTYNGPTVFNTGSTIALGNATGTTQTLAGNISGTGGVISQTGLGTSILSGNNSFTGGLVIGSGSGNLRLTSDTAAGTGTITINGGGTVTGTLQLSGGINVVNNIAFAAARTLPDNVTLGGRPHIESLSGNNTISSPIVVTAGGGNGINLRSNAGTLTLSGAMKNTVATSSRPISLSGDGDFLVTGAITDGTIDATTYLEKEGPGTATVTNINSYTATTLLKGGALVVSGSLSGTTGVIVSNSATLLLSNAFNDSIDNVGANRNLTVGSVNNAADLTLGSGGATAATLKLGGTAQTEVLGGLTLSANSTVDFGGTDGTATSANTLLFSNLAISPGATVNVLHWTGSLYSGAPFDFDHLGAQDRLLFDADPTEALANQLNFFDDKGVSLGIGHVIAFSDGTGYTGYELVPIPEPSTLCSGLLVLGLVGLRRRRQSLARSRRQ